MQRLLNSEHQHSSSIEVNSPNGKFRIIFKLSEGSICKFNQKGYCKFKQNCRNRPQNEICQHEDTCRSTESPYRHPTGCRNYFREGLCRFGDGFAYRHKTDINWSAHAKETLQKKDEEIIDIQEERSQLKQKWGFINHSHG